MRLGICADGRQLTYDESLYEFRLGRLVTPYAQIRELDDHAHIHWLALEQRDWFRRISPGDLAACNRRALTERVGEEYAGMTPEERVQADAARDDSVLAGHVVEADPSLVQAVANALEKEGLIGAGAPGAAPGVKNPLATADLPQGMEPLAQMTRAQGDRKMTHSEKRLMQKILKNNDKAKAKREKEADDTEAAAQKLREKDAQKKQREQERPGAASQRRVTQQQGARAQRATRRSGDTAAGQGQGTGARAPAAAEQEPAGPTEYYDAQGHLIAVDHGGEDAGTSAPAVSPEEQALIDMRARNQQAAAKLQSQDVPGYAETKKRRFFGS